MKNWELKLPINRSTINPRSIPAGGLSLGISRNSKAIIAGAVSGGYRFLDFSRLERHLSPPAM